MAIINLTCEHCGGNIVLDDSHEIGTCENCFSQFIVCLLYTSDAADE